VEKATWLNTYSYRATQNVFQKLQVFGIQLKKFPVTANSAVSQANTKVFLFPPCQVVSGQLAWQLLLMSSRVGVHTFIRVGSTGAIQKDINCGDLIISTAAVRLDYTSNCYIMPEYPAVASYEVLLALIEAAESLGIGNYHVGITATTADFYAGQNRPATSISRMEDLLPTLQKAKVLNFEMETATLFTLASLYGLRAGSVCAVYANRCRNEFKPGAGEENAITVANEATKILYEWDSKKRRKKKHWLFPSLLTI